MGARAVETCTYSAVALNMHRSCGAAGKEAQHGDALAPGGCCRGGAAVHAAGAGQPPLRRQCGRVCGGCGQGRPEMRDRGETLMCALAVQQLGLVCEVAFRGNCCCVSPCCMLKPVCELHVQLQTSHCQRAATSRRSVWILSANSAISTSRKTLCYKSYSGQQPCWQTKQGGKPANTGTEHVRLRRDHS